MASRFKASLVLHNAGDTLSAPYAATRTKTPKLILLGVHAP